MNVRLDRLTTGGLILGGTALFGTQILEGGDPRALAQGPAALVVCVGTLAATLASIDARALSSLREALREVFSAPVDRRPELPGRYRDLAIQARKLGLVALDGMAHTLPGRFMRRALGHAIDGCDEEQLRRVLHADAEARHNTRDEAARVLEIAGGYAPTMGILGAVLGLIRAMESLANPGALGAGIAVAFIATLYGVGLANLVLLPLAEKIRARMHARRREEEMVIEATVALQSGMAPRMIERMLEAHLEDRAGR